MMSFINVQYADVPEMERNTYTYFITEQNASLFKN